MVVGVGSGERHVLRIPPEEKPLIKPNFDLSSKPPQIAKGTRGPVEWSGSGLSTISGVSFKGNAQDFTTYADGTHLIVYLNPSDTGTEGKAILECKSAAGDKFSLPIFVV